MATTCRHPLRPSSDHRYRSPATHRIPIDSSMKKITRYIRQLTVKTPNSSAQTHARHQDRVSPTHSNTTLPLPPRSTRRSTHRGPWTQSRSEGPLIRDARWIGEELTNRGRRTSFAQNPATTANCVVGQDCRVKSIDVLPDDDLLSIFDFYMACQIPFGRKPIHAVDAWRALVHVCRRWRSVVFGSPRRLNLRLSCTS